jgi:hypothetical protein
VRNVKIFSTVGRVVESGLARIGAGVTLTQHDNLTAQFMQQYGDFIAVASADNLVEQCGGQVNKEYLVSVLGWTLPEAMKTPAAKAEPVKVQTKAAPEPTPEPAPEEHTSAPDEGEETAESSTQEAPLSDTDRGGKKKRKR